MTLHADSTAKVQISYPENKHVAFIRFSKIGSRPIEDKTEKDNVVSPEIRRQSGGGCLADYSQLCHKGLCNISKESRDLRLLLVVCIHRHVRIAAAKARLCLRSVRRSLFGVHQ